MAQPVTRKTFATLAASTGLVLAAAVGTAVVSDRGSAGHGPLHGHGTNVLGEQLPGSSPRPAAGTTSPVDGGRPFAIAGDAGDLYPGIQHKTLVLTVTNPNPFLIRVTSLDVM